MPGGIRSGGNSSPVLPVAIAGKGIRHGPQTPRRLSILEGQEQNGQAGCCHLIYLFILSGDRKGTRKITRSGGGDNGHLKFADSAVLDRKRSISLEEIRQAQRRLHYPSFFDECWFRR